MAKQTSITDPFKLTITANQLAKLQSHLFPGDYDEHGAILAAGLVETPRGIRLLVRDLFLAEDGKDYVVGERGYHMLKAEYISEKVIYCRNERLVYLAVHCHGGLDNVGFSPTDLDSHRLGYPALCAISKQPVGALVLAQNAVAGEIWLPNGGIANLAEATVVGDVISHIYSEPPAPPPDSRPGYDRQVRIFGDRGQDVLSRLKVGIIGAGGAGSIINEQVARLGVGHVVMADPECIDETNKPRVVGSTDADVSTSTSKILIAERLAREAKSDIHFEGIKGDLVDAPVARHFVDCDFIFLAADTMQARHVFNSLVHQYLIPGIQVGVKVPVDPTTGEVGEIFCSCWPVTPDSGCLWCNGLITASQLQEEALSDEERRAQQYVGDSTVEAPSVITLNAISAAHSTNMFLFSITGLRSPDSVGGGLRWLPAECKMMYLNPRSDAQCLKCGDTPLSIFARGDGLELPTKLQNT